jgi:hypothetical protein
VAVLAIVLYVLVVVFIYTIVLSFASSAMCHCVVYKNLRDIGVFILRNCNVITVVGKGVRLLSKEMTVGQAVRQAAAYCRSS